MHVITHRRLLEFGRQYPDAVVPLDVWYRIMKAHRFADGHAVRQMFGSVDFVKGFAVFNIGGHKYRLVAAMRYSTGTNVGRCFVRYVFAHAEYDRWSAEQRKKKRRE